MIAIIGGIGAGKSLYSSLFIEKGLIVRDEVNSKHLDPFLVEPDVVVSQSLRRLEGVTLTELHEVKRLSGLKILFWRMPDIIRVRISKFDPELDKYVYQKSQCYFLSKLLELARKVNPEYMEQSL